MKRRAGRRYGSAGTASSCLVLLQLSTGWKLVHTLARKQGTGRNGSGVGAVPSFLARPRCKEAPCYQSHSAHVRLELGCSDPQVEKVAGLYIKPHEHLSITTGSY